MVHVVLLLVLFPIANASKSMWFIFVALGTAKASISHDSDYSLNGSKGMAATKNKIPGIDQKPINGRNLKGMKALQSNLKVEKDKADFVRKSRMNKEKQKKNSSHEQADSKKGKPQLSKSKPKR